MDLIAKVLNFSDDQKVTVGLKVGSVNIIGSLFTSLMGSSNAISKPPQSQDIEGVFGRLCLAGFV